MEDEIKIEEQIKDLEKQIKDLEGGLALEGDLEENKKLYSYLLEQKRYELIEQRAQEKLADIEKIKKLEIIIQKTEKKLSDIEKIKELRKQLNINTEKN